MPASTAQPREDGFAIIVALWAIAVVGLVGLGYVASARARVTAAAVTAEHGRLHLLAEAAASKALADLVDDGRRGSLAAPKRPTDGRAVACAIAPDVSALVTVEDEAGKVNLNTAPVELLQATFGLIGMGPDAAASLAGLVNAERQRMAAASGTSVPGVRRQRRGERRVVATTFQSVFQLAALSPEADAAMPALLPYLTVHTSLPGIDPATAPLSLLTGIGRRAPAPPRGGLPALDPQRAGWQLKPEWSSPSERQNFLVRAAVASGRSRSSVEALVTVAPLPQPPFRVIEWRRDKARPGDADLPAPADLPPC